MDRACPYLRTRHRSPADVVQRDRFERGYVVVLVGLNGHVGFVLIHLFAAAFKHVPFDL